MTREPGKNNFRPKKQPKNSGSKYSKKSPEKPQQESIRLNRFIANAGICSRRDADKLIQEGEITVNGKIITELGTKIKPSDKVKYRNKALHREKFAYVLLNKPKDFITTMDDPENRKTVMSLVKKASNARIYPVGRLDRNTTGLLLFTNDGELAEKLTHPSNKVKKIYQVDLDNPLKQEDLEEIKKGVQLEDGPVTVDDIQVLSKDARILGVEIHEGRNRIIRRLFEALGYEVVKLDRVMYAGLTKKDLQRGRWRLLTTQEIINLKHFRT